MSEEKKLAKINSIRLGSGGYQDAMFGITFSFTGQGWGVDDFWGVWSREPDQYTPWTSQDRIQRIGEIMVRLMSVMKQAKVQSLEDLEGIPVEITLEHNTIKDWRILEEVL